MNPPFSATVHSRIQKIYTRPRLYDHLYKHTLDLGRKVATLALPQKRPLKVLEVGFGSGLSLRYYPEDIELTGIDPSEHMLSIAKKRAAKEERIIELLEMDGAHLTFPDHTFDAVFFLYVLSVAPNTESLLQEAWRVLKPGGVAVIANHFQGGIPLLRKLTFLTQHIGYHTQMRMEQVLEAPGFTVLQNRKLGSNRIIVLQKTNEE